MRWDLGRSPGKSDIRNSPEPYRDAGSVGSALRKSGSLVAMRRDFADSLTLGSAAILTLPLPVSPAVVSALELVRVLATDDEKIPQIRDIIPLRLLGAHQDVNLFVVIAIPRCHVAADLVSQHFRDPRFVQPEPGQAFAVETDLNFGIAQLCCGCDVVKALNPPQPIHHQV